MSHVRSSVNQVLDAHNQPPRTGRSCLRPFTMNSTAIAARIRPKSRIPTFMPIGPRAFPTQAAFLSTAHESGHVDRIVEANRKALQAAYA